MESEKEYTQLISKSFHISMAALGLNSSSKEEVSVCVYINKSQYVLCTLKPGVIYQQSLNLNFTEGEEVTFSLEGDGVVHLSGYVLPEPKEYEFSISSDSDAESSSVSESILKRLGTYGAERNTPNIVNDSNHVNDIDSNENHIEKNPSDNKYKSDNEVLKDIVHDVNISHVKITPNVDPLTKECLGETNTAHTEYVSENNCVLRVNKCSKECKTNTVSSPVAKIKEKNLDKEMYDNDCAENNKQSCIDSGKNDKTKTNDEIIASNTLINNDLGNNNETINNEISKDKQRKQQVKKRKNEKQLKKPFTRNKRKR